MQRRYLVLFLLQLLRKFLNFVTIEAMVALENVLLSLAYHPLFTLAILQQLYVPLKRAFEQLSLALEKYGLLVRHTNLLL